MSDPRHKGEVLGFRQWTLNGHQLHSSNTSLGAGWKIGVNKAECRRRQFEESALYGGSHAVWITSGSMKPPTAPPLARSPRDAHEAPAKDCMCGYYAYHEVPSLNNDYFGPSEQVYGAVRAWGRMEVHVDGFRAEYAEPIALAYTESQPYGHVVKVMALAGEFGIPCVPLEQLEGVARGIAEPVPPSLRPERMKPPTAEEMYAQRLRMVNSYYSGHHYASGAGRVQFSSSSIPFGTSPIRSKRWARNARRWAYANAGVAITNAGFFAFLGHHWWSATAMGFSSVCAADMERRSRRHRKEAAA